MLYYLFFFFSLKIFTFFSSFFILESFGVFISSICPLTLYLVFLFLFSSFGSKEKVFYKELFLLIVILIFMCFNCSYSVIFLYLLEATSIPISLLIIYLSKDSDKFLSVLYMLLINLSGSLPFMYFSIYFLSDFLVSFVNLLNIEFKCFESFLLFFCYSLLLCSKMPLFLFHSWLTKAHVSASGASSMLLASLMLKMATFGIYKYCVVMIGYFKYILSYLFSFSLIGSLIFSLIMIRFFDMKYVIACSSVLHMSMIYPSILSGSSVGLFGSIMMMVGHGLVSYYLFFVVTLIYENSYSRNADLNKSLESTSKTMSMVLFMFIFLNLGIPPFINFLSELLFMMVMFSLSDFMVYTYLMILTSSVLFTIFFSTKILFGKNIMIILKEVSFNMTLLSFSYIAPILLQIFMI